MSLDADSRNPPSAQHPVHLAAHIQHALAFAKRQVPYGTDLQVVRDVVLADRFLEPAVVGVHRRGTRPVRVSIGEDLREHVRGLELQTFRIATENAKTSVTMNNKLVDEL